MPMARRMKGSAIRAVTVADQVAWGLVPAAGLGQLTGKPFRIGMGCQIVEAPTSAPTGLPIRVGLTGLAAEPF
jgi:hypothetical protein